MKESNAALAEWEDEWTPDNEREVTEMVSAEVVLPVRIGVLGGPSEHRDEPRHDYPLWHIEAARTRLHLDPPVIVTLEYDDGEVIISNSQLRIWGTGTDQYQALHDFSQTFVDVLRAYEETPDVELTPDAREYLSLLRSFIRLRANI